MGEMAYFFQIADIAFMGGSLVPVGGHNLGPHFFNFSDITRQLVDKKACQIIHDETELATHVLQLLGSSEQRHTMGMAAFDVVAANQGALEKSLTAIDTVLARLPQRYA